MSIVRVSSIVALAMTVAGCAALFGPSKYTEKDGDIPEGTIFRVRLEAPVNSRYAHLNEPIRARSLDDVLTDTGVMMLPRHTLFTGSIHDRRGERIWLALDRAVVDGQAQMVRARFIGSENGFIGRLHAGDVLVVRLDAPMWSVVAVRNKTETIR